MSRASYDLTRLRRNGLIIRVTGHNLYRLTDDGLAFAIFYTKVHNRVLRPLLATDARRPHRPSARRYAPSTPTSTPDSPRHDYRRRLPDTLTKCQSPSDQGSPSGYGRSRVDAERWVSPAPPGSVYLAVINITASTAIHSSHGAMLSRSARPIQGVGSPIATLRA